MDDDKLLIGSEEWCALPDLGIPAITARIDSGARTSSLHAFNVKPFSRHGEQWVRFAAHPLPHSRRAVVHCVAKVIDRRGVKSSSGQIEQRYVIGTTLALGGRRWPIELTLSNRDSMGYRMLLGRSAMAGRLLVDPGAHFHLGRLAPEELAGYYGQALEQRDGLGIGVLAGDERDYLTRRLLEAGEERGHTMRFLDLGRCYVDMDRHSARVGCRDGEALAGLHAVIPQIGPEQVQFGCAILRQLSAMGVFCFNTAGSIVLAQDKLHLFRLLLDHGVAVPHTGFAASPADGAALVQRIGGPALVIKVLRGGCEHRVAVVESGHAAENLIDALIGPDSHVLVQEYVGGTPAEEVFCLVAGGRIVAAVQNHRRYAGAGGRSGSPMPGIPARLTAAERAMVRKAARALRLNMAGVTLLRSVGRPLVLDVTDRPDIAEPEKVTGKDIADRLIRVVERHFGGHESGLVGRDRRGG